MKKYITILILITILFSCSKDNKKEEKLINKNNKIPFYIETKTLNHFSNEILFKKSAKLVSNSQIQVNSQASGKVSKINFDIGDKVKVGDILVVLEDNISNYYLNLEKAKNALERAKINYESTILTLDKNISDLEIAYNKAKSFHELLLKDNEIKLKKAIYDLDTSKINQDISLNKSSLDIEKLQSELDKQKLDFNNSILNDENTISTFKQNIITTKKSIEIIYFDIINYLDEIFGVSDKNKHKNDSFEIYLGAKNTSNKSLVENNIRLYLINYQDFKNTEIIINNDKDFEKYLTNLEKIILDLKDLIYLSQNVIKDSINSSTFSQNQIDQYYQSLNTYSNSLQQIYSNFSNLNLNINSFLNTYLKNRLSRQEQISILEKQIEITKKQLDLSNLSTSSNLENTKISLDRIKIDLDNNLLNSETQLKTAKNNLDNAIKNKEITLKSLKNAIKDAEIALSEANKNISKLTIKSPISGIVSKKLVDVGQEITLNTPVFIITEDSHTKVEVYLTKDELSLISLNDKVKLNYFNNEIYGKVESISNIASPDFTYLTIISILDKVDIIGDFVEVNFLSKTDKILLPISILDVIGKNKALVNILKDNKIISKEVEIGQVFGDKIEIISGLEKNDEIIITDIKKFNEVDFELIKK